METPAPPPAHQWVHVSSANRPTGVASLNSPAASVGNADVHGGGGGGGGGGDIRARSPEEDGDGDGDGDGDSGRSDVRSPPAKRRREEKERTRVSRACDRCKK